MTRIEPIHTFGGIDKETGEKLPDMLAPPVGIYPIEFRDGAYWIYDIIKE